MRQQQVVRFDCQSDGCSVLLCYCVIVLLCCHVVVLLCCCFVVLSCCRVVVLMFSKICRGIVQSIVFAIK